MYRILFIVSVSVQKTLPIPNSRTQRNKSDPQICCMETQNYHRLSYKERVVIETLLSENKTPSFIARQLGRNRSTITREINKWMDDKPSSKKRPLNVYKADLAHWCAEDDYLNKRNLDKISKHPALRIYIYRGLLNKWSPEQIAGRIKDDYPGNSIMNISYEAIYMYIYRHRQARLLRKSYKRHHKRTIMQTLEIIILTLQPFLKIKPTG